MIGKRILRKREVLERLGIRKTTLHENFIKTGRLRFVQIGARAVGVTMCQFSFCTLPRSSGVMIPRTFLKLCPPLVYSLETSRWLAAQWPHGSSHTVVLEIKCSPRRLGDSP